jgi:hypothetical protein
VCAPNIFFLSVSINRALCDLDGPQCCHQHRSDFVSCNFIPCLGLACTSFACATDLDASRCLLILEDIDASLSFGISQLVSIQASELDKVLVTLLSGLIERYLPSYR